jgi:hypothetical protein
MKNWTCLPLGHELRSSGYTVRETDEGRDLTASMVRYSRGDHLHRFVVRRIQRHRRGEYNMNLKHYHWQSTGRGQLRETADVKQTET